MRLVYINFVSVKRIRDVAQSGRVLVWGASGRRFKSCHPDYIISINNSSSYLQRIAAFLCLSIYLIDNIILFLILLNIRKIIYPTLITNLFFFKLYYDV